MKKQSEFQLKKVLNKKGMSLLEVLIVVGVLSIVGLGLATLMVNSNKQTKSVAAKADFNSLVSLVQATFSNTKTCITAFGDGAAPQLDAFPKTVSIKVADGDLTVGKYSDTLEILKFELVSKTKVGGAQQWEVPLEMVVKLGASDGSMVGANVLSHRFNLLLTIDETDGDRIKGCSGTFNEFWVKGNEVGSIVYQGGKVGIGTASPGMELDVNGKIQSNAFMYRSDLRLKENVLVIPSALSRALKLSGVQFDWKTQPGQNQIGFIAQDVEKVFPEVVSTDEKTGMKSVAYGNLVAPLVEAIKEQQKIIQKQQSEIDEIKRALANSR